MIVCTRCGQSNRDAARTCQRCGRKLQSARPMVVSSGPPAWKRLQPIKLKVDVKKRAELIRMIEACAYSVILVSTSIVCMFSGVWWPLYIVLGLVALLALARRL